MARRRPSSYFTESYRPLSGRQTLFTNQTPVNLNLNDAGNFYELGVRFTVSVAGRIAAIRYWRDSNDTNNQVGKIWSNAGQILRIVQFSGESSSGWQESLLPTPLRISANTEYVVSVTCTPWFVSTQAAFYSSLSNENITAVAGTAVSGVGGNGVFAAVGTFPTGSFNNSNYFRDIVFIPD